MTNVSAQPQPVAPSNDALAPREGSTAPDVKLVSRTPPRFVPNDPLAMLKALSEEEKIALFS